MKKEKIKTSKQTKKNQMQTKTSVLYLKIKEISVEIFFPNILIPCSFIPKDPERNILSARQYKSQAFSTFSCRFKFVL